MQSKTIRADFGNFVKDRNMRYGWPLVSSDWDELPMEIVNSQKWRSVVLGHNEAGSIPPEPGVYMMCAKPPSINPEVGPFNLLYETLYVGESENLRRRFREHLNTPSPKVRAARQCYPISLMFWYHLVEIEQIKHFESRLIQCLGPAANDKPGIDPGAANIGDPIPAGRPS